MTSDSAQMVRLGGHLCGPVHGNSRCLDRRTLCRLPFSVACISPRITCCGVLNAYALFFGGFPMLGGRVADKLGRRRVFVTGVVVFTTASLFCGLATSSGWLVTARAVQGLGAAISSPAALSILTVTFVEGRERNTALSIWGRSPVRAAHSVSCSAASDPRSSAGNGSST